MGRLFVSVCTGLLLCGIGYHFFPYLAHTATVLGGFAITYMMIVLLGAIAISYKIAK